MTLCQAATKRQLTEKIEKDGIETLSVREMKRLKRLITGDTIKQNNAAQLAK